MNDLVIRLGDGQIVTFDPAQARTAITAHQARAMVEARMGHVDEAIEHADKAIAMQFAFVTWWEKNKHKGRPSKEKPDRSVRLSDAAPDLDFKTVSRWRKALLVEDDHADMSKYHKALEKAAKKIRKACGFEAQTQVEENSGENEWYTPPEYIEAARCVMGEIDLDPASCELANRLVQAGHYFDAKDNGLTQPWEGRVWMNPPYAQPLIRQFCDKLVNSLDTVSAACVLVNNATETAWGQSLLEHASAVCFIRGRVRFMHSNGEQGEAAGPLQGQMVCYYGLAPAAFEDSFGRFGKVLR